MKKHHLLPFFLIVLICSFALAQQPDRVQNPLELNKLLNLSNVHSGYTYFFVNFQLTKG